jgi:hypothetical protein
LPRDTLRVTSESSTCSFRSRSSPILYLTCTGALRPDVRHRSAVRPVVDDKMMSEREREG